MSTALSHARYYLMKGQPEEAEIQLKWIELMEPWQKLPWIDLAVVYLDQEKPTQSIAILEPLRGEKLTDPTAWLTLARGYEKVGRPSQTEESLLTLIRQNKKESETETAYQMLIKLYRSQNRLEEAYQSQSDLALLASGNKDFKFEKVLLSLAIHPDEGLQEWKLISGKPAWLVQVGNQDC